MKPVREKPVVPFEDMNPKMQVITALKATDPEYFTRLLSTRTPEHRAGSYFDMTPEQLRAEVFRAKWEPYSPLDANGQPIVSGDARAYRATINGGRLGMTEVATVPEQAQLYLIDPKGTGNWSVSTIGASEPHTNHVTMIVGQRPDDQMVYDLCMPLTLFQALYHYTDDELRQLAQFMDMPVRDGIATHHLRGEVEDWLRRRETVERLWEQLEEIDRKYIAEILHWTRQFDLDAFEMRYGGCPSVLRGWINGRRPLSPVRLLAERNEVYREVHPALLKIVPPPPAVSVGVLSTPIGRHVRFTEPDALRDVLSILNLIDAGKVPVTEKTGAVGSAAIREIEKVLRGDGVTIRATAWATMFESTSYCYAKDGNLVLAEYGLSASRGPASEALHHVWRKWMTQHKRDELRRISMQGVYLVDGIDCRRRRARLCDALRECPVGTWISIADFNTFIREGGFYFALCWGEKAIPLLERYISMFLSEFAATAGIVDLTYDDFLCSFRVTPLGAFLLGLAEEYSPPSAVAAAKLIALSSLLLMFDGEPGPEQATFLDRYCERETSTMWKLSKVKTLAAVGRGFTTKMLREFIETYDEQPIPELMDAWLTKIDKELVSA